MRRKVVIVAFVVAGLVLVGAVLGRLALSGFPGGVPADAPAAAPCLPEPCANPSGFEVRIASIQKRPAVVSMLAAFTNHTQPGLEAVSYRHTSPADFVLVDGAGQSHKPFVSAAGGCPDWGSIDVQRGSTSPPEPLCFQVPQAAHANLILVWSPDLGFLSEGARLPLQ